MKNKYLKILFLLIFYALSLSFSHAQEAPFSSVKPLQGSVQKVPEAFYGTWRVVSKLEDTDSPVSFKSKGVDLWNLTLESNVITLSNPFSGASAQVKVDSVDGNKVIFTKNGKYENKIITDLVCISISEETFTGVDLLKIDTISDVNGNIIKTETARYSIKGEKIAGESIIGN